MDRSTQSSLFMHIFALFPFHHAPRIDEQVIAGRGGNFKLQERYQSSSAYQMHVNKNTFDKLLYK